MTGRPRIVCLAPLPPPATGQSVVTETFCDALAQVADVEMVDTADRVSVWRRPGTFPLARVAGWSSRLADLRRHLARRPSAVYLTPASSTLGLLRDAAALALVPRHVRIVAHVHVGDYGRLLTHPVWGGLARWTVGRFERVLVPSAYAASGIRSSMPAARVEVLPNPVPPDVRFTPDEVESARAAREGQTPHVLFLSNMIPSKGYALLAEALALLARQNVDVRATFAGAWSSEAQRSEFETRLGALGLAGQARVVGAVEREAVKPLLSSADVVAFPSTYPHESFGLVMVEAMGAGCAVVAVRHAAAAEVVRDGTDGCLVTPDAPSLAAGLADALKNRVRYGRAAAERARETFAAEPLADAFVDAVLGREPADVHTPALSSSVPAR